MEKFKIPVIPRTTNRSIRFPNDVLDGIEKAIEGKECTFTAFVVEAVRVALRNVEEANTEKDCMYCIISIIQKIISNISLRRNLI